VKSLNFLNYKIASSFGRKHFLRGGVAILVERNVGAEIIEVATSTEKKFEVCATFLTLGLQKIIICAIYRPSNPECNKEMDSFFVQLDSLLVKLMAVYKRRKFSKIFVCGDFNINMFRKTSDSIRLLQVFEKLNFLS
jgi:exonuclease III